MSTNRRSTMLTIETALPAHARHDELQREVEREREYQRVRDEETLLLSAQFDGARQLREQRGRTMTDRRRSSWALPLLAPLAFGVLTACSSDRKIDAQLQADLAAAQSAPRSQYMSPQELAYSQGYAPNGQVAYPPGYQPYPQQYAQYPQYSPYPQPAVYSQPQTRVVYVPQPAATPRRTSSAGGSSGAGRGSGDGVGTIPAAEREERNTQKGAIIGAATGAAIGVATARDKVRGGAIGALGGAVLGGVIGHQVKTPKN